jgi:nitrogen fixation protein NifB
MQQARVALNDRLKEIGVAVSASATDAAAKIAEDHKGCGTSSEGGKASCGYSHVPADMAPEVREKFNNHPC